MVSRMAVAISQRRCGDKLGLLAAALRDKRLGEVAEIRIPISNGVDVDHQPILMGAQQTK